MSHETIPANSHGMNKQNLELLSGCRQSIAGRTITTIFSSEHQSLQAALMTAFE